MTDSQLVPNQVRSPDRFDLPTGSTSGGGQSLLEAIVALAVAMLVILALVWVTTVSIRNADFAKKQAQAAKFAQEGMENIRAYRDASWTNFWSLTAPDPGTNYGFSGAVPSGGCPTSPNLGTYFIRCVNLKQVGDEKAQAVVTVSWIDSAGTHKSEQISYFSKWE
ncbi:MAG: type IV pilus modification PilV family protein [Patescibacteria group bacterium]